MILIPIIVVICAGFVYYNYFMDCKEFRKRTNNEFKYINKFDTVLLVIGGVALIVMTVLVVLILAY